MNLLRKILFTTLLLVFAAVLGLYFSGNMHLLKAIKNTYLVGKTGPTIDDYHKFINRAVETNQPKPLSSYTEPPEVYLTPEEENLFKKWETSAFVILKDGKMLFEKYWDNYSDESLTNSFSMAKSFTCCALVLPSKKERLNLLISLLAAFYLSIKEAVFESNTYYK